MEEKRELSRQQIHQFVQIDFNKEEFLAAEGLNISSKGLLCRLPRPLSAGQRIFVMLNLGTPLQPDMISLDGIIVWSRQDSSCSDEVCPWLAGVEFIDLTESVRAHLEAFLSHASS